MDYQNRPGSKIGGGGVASDAQSNYDRRERLRKLALETIDLSKDPYFMKVRTTMRFVAALTAMAESCGFVRVQALLDASYE